MEKGGGGSGKSETVITRNAVSCEQRLAGEQREQMYTDIVLIVIKLCIGDYLIPYLIP